MKRTITLRLSSLTLVLLLAGFWSTGAAQDQIKRPPVRVPAVADTVLQLVPTGWRVEQSTLKEIDLNGDGKPDAAFVISNGRFDETGPEESTVVKHVLILALRGDDGKLHRSVVSDAAVLDGDEGGAFGDPFEELSIAKGTVVITHYGGSRDRWGFTQQYRYQNEQWMLIGLSFGNTDSLAPNDHFDNHDINLTTGLVRVNEKGDYEGRPKKPEIGGDYYELETQTVDHAPRIDGDIASGEWPGYTVKLNERNQIYRSRRLWHGREDLSARLHAVRFGKDLFLSAEVVDNQVSPGDSVKLVNKRGLVIKPVESKLTPGTKGYVFEARYSLESLAKASGLDDPSLLDALENDPLSGAGNDLEGLQLPLAVQIIDVDESATPRARGVLSTRLLGSPYNGSIRIFRQGTLVLISDIIE